MSAGRRRTWWMYQNHQSIVEDKKEEEDGRLESEGSERRVPSEGHAEGSDRTEI